VSFRIPFHRETFIPKTINGNDAADLPVSFELSMAAGADHARVKSVLIATAGTAGWIDGENAWSPEMQAAVIEAFRTSPQLFSNCVGAIQNLSAPAVLCRRVGINTPEKAKDEDDIPITNGAQFAKVAPYMVTLGLELACEISRLTQRGAIDPRFTAPSSGSAKTPGTTNGSATAAPSTSDGGVTAASLA
jgi:hypothetical protein